MRQCMTNAAWVKSSVRKKQVTNPLNVTRYIKTFRNWPAVISARKVKGPGVLVLRDSTRLSLSDMHEEIWAFWSIYWERCYDRDFNNIPRDGTILDLGANVGIFSAYAATRLVPDGRVIAVEANPKLIGCL